MSRPIRHALALGLAGTLALTACSGGSTEPPDGSGEQPQGSGNPTTGTSAGESTPDPPTPQVAAPPEQTTVLAGEDAGELALAASQALYAQAPVVVLAGTEDVPAQARAASVAVRLGAPLLLTPDIAAGTGSGTQAPADPVADELDRLGATALLTFGADPEQWARDLGEGPAVVAAPADAESLAAVTGATFGAPQPVAEEELTGEVAALMREDTALLEVDAAGTPTGEPSSSEAPASDEAPTPDDEPASEEAAEGDRLPPVAAAPPLEDVLLLASFEAADVAAVATARAAGTRVLLLEGDDPRADSEAIAALSEQPPETVVAIGEEFGPAEQLADHIAVAATGVELPGGGQVVYPGRLMVALYGHPGTAALGVLGEQPLEETIERAHEVAAEYEPVSDVPVVPTFEIITTIASATPGGDGDYSSESSVEDLRPWIEAAGAAGVYVVLDLQPGRTDFLTQAKLYEELLVYPHVGLALDAEWRLRPDQVHLRQIGSVSAEEVNSVVTWLADLTQENVLPQKVLVLHQFRSSMLRDRDQIDTSREELAIVMHGDGFGTPELKLETWGVLTADLPEGMWLGWKNFYDEDTPTLTPAETLAVDPPPRFVSYQ